jgi:coenzyme PQQ precursor peptide PqqA
MMIRARAVRHRPEYRTRRLIRAAGSPTKEDPTMKWETPEAIDFRFGMEITMYISNR